MSVPIKQSVKINFGGGLDLKTDPNQVDASNFLALNNMVFTTGERLSKRNGFPSLGNTVNAPVPALTYSAVGASITSARKVFSYNNELLLADGFNLYSFDSANNAWNYKGRETTVALSTTSVAAGANVFTNCDESVDTQTGVKIFAYGQYAFGAPSITNVFYSIQDIATGQFIVNQASLGTTYINPRCVSIAGKSWIFAVNVTDGKLYYQAIVGQAIAGSLTALITNLNSSKPTYDVDVDVNTGNIYIAYYNSTPAITISSLTSSMVVGNTIIKAESGTNGVSWFGDGTNIWVCYNNGTATKAFIVNNAVTTTTLAPTVVDSTALATSVNNVTGVWSSTQSKAFIFYDPFTADAFTANLTGTAAINYNTLTLAGSPGTPGLFMGSLSLNSKAFSVSGIPHVVGIYTYPTYSKQVSGTLIGGQVVQATNFLLNLYNVTPSMGSASHNDVVANIAGKISPDQAGNHPPPSGLLGGVHQSTSGVWNLALLQNSNFAFSASLVPFFTPMGVIGCSFDFNLSNPDEQSIGNNALISGAQVSMYDGATLAEQNFHIYPNALGYSIATTGGSMGAATTNTLYGYIYLYEWIDNQGQVHRSFPSPVVNPLAASQNYTFASATTSGSVTLTIPTLRVTNKSGSQVVINVYRTVGNGSVYFLVGSGAYGTVLNDPSVNSVSYVDGAADNGLISSIQLYTTGALGYYAPPATSSLTNFKNRAVAIASEDPYQVAYSNHVQQNFPAQFVPEFLQNIGTVGGPLVTIAQMDDKMILFKAGSQDGPAIYYINGQGPAPSGAGNDFTDPQPVAVDAGAVDRPSVVLTPEGLMFKSIKGIYLINRSLQVSYIGAPVEAYNQFSVLSAHLIPNTTQVRYLLSGGVILVYDYFYKKWSSWTPPAGISDCIFQGQHTYVSSAGTVYQEQPGIYYDGGNTPVLQSFTTAWIKLAGLQGYQRSFFFYLLAKYLSAHQLQLQISYDFSATPEQTTLITPDSSSNLENWRVFLAKQRCQAFQISLQEIYGGTPGAGFTMSGLNLIVGAKSAFRTASSSETVG
jgi:hypothetical protein